MMKNVVWKITIGSRIDGPCGRINIQDLPERATYYIENASISIAKRRAAGLAIADGVQYPIVLSVERQHYGPAAPK